jgi:hypothetical protein
MQETRSVLVMKLIHLWLYRELIPLCYEKKPQLMNALHMHKVQMSKGKPQVT